MDKVHVVNGNRIPYEVLKRLVTQSFLKKKKVMGRLEFKTVLYFASDCLVGVVDVGESKKGSIQRSYELPNINNS